MASLSTRTFRQSITCSANALIIYIPSPKMLKKHTVYIVDSIRTKLPYLLLNFPHTCLVFCVESLIEGVRATRCFSPFLEFLEICTL